MTTSTATRKTQKPAQQTHGFCRLTTLADRPLSEGGIALLTIRPNDGKPWSDFWVTKEGDGYRLEKLTSSPEDKVAVYHVTPLGGCDCPDAQFYSGGHGCKHARVLKAVGLQP